MHFTPLTASPFGPPPARGAAWSSTEQGEILAVRFPRQDAQECQVNQGDLPGLEGGGGVEEAEDDGVQEKATWVTPAQRQG